MSEPPLLAALVCQKCGTTNPPHAARCWLCDGTGKTNPYAASPPMLQPIDKAGAKPSLLVKPNERVEMVFTFLVGGTVALALLVGVGLAAQDPGLLVPYVIILGPAFLVTGVRAAYTITKQEQLRASSLFWTFLWSGLFTVAVLGVLVMASIIALFLWCVHALGQQALP